MRLPRPSVSLAVVLAAIFTAPAASQTPTTSGTFVVLSGTDTLSIEHFTRSARELTGSIETRVNGRTSRATYSVLHDASGRPTRLESSLTVPQRGLSTAAFDLAGDSISGPMMVFDRESYFRGGAPRGAMPLLTLVSTLPNATTLPPMSIAMLDDVIRAAARTPAATDVAVIEYGNANPVSRTRAVTRVDQKTVDVALFDGIRVTLDASGHIESARSALPTAAQIRSGQRQDDARPVRRALQPVGAAQRAADCRQRCSHHERFHACDPHEQRRHRGGSGWSIPVS